MAAAQVTGIAAVLWGKYPNKSNQFIKELLLNSANSDAVTGDCGNGIADYEKSKNNYVKMNRVYEDFRRMGKSDRYAAKRAGKSLDRNTVEVETHEEVNYVNGAWKESQHRSLVTKTGILEDNDNIAIVKKGAVAPDQAKSTKSYSKHPCFHGGGNYLANTQYLYALTREYRNTKGKGAVKLPTYKEVFDNVNPYKGLDEGYKIRETLTEKTRNELFAECLGKNNKKWTNKKKAYVMLGVTLHNATDAFAHRGYRDIGSDGREDWWKIIHKSEDVTNEDTRKKSPGYIWKQAAHSNKVYKTLYSKLAIADYPSEIKMLSRLAGITAKGILSSVKTKKKKECYNCFETAFLNYGTKRDDAEFKMENVDKYWKKVKKLTKEKAEPFDININQKKYTVSFCKQKNTETEIEKGKVKFKIPYNKKQKYAVWTQGKNRIYFEGGKIHGKNIVFSVSRKKIKTLKITVCLTNHSAIKKKTYKLSAKCEISFDKGKDKTITGSMKKMTIKYKGNKKFTVKNKFKCKGKKFAGWKIKGDKQISKNEKIPFIQSGAMTLCPVFKKEEKGKKGKK